MNRLCRLRDFRAVIMGLLGGAFVLAAPSDGNPPHPQSCLSSTVQFILASDVYKYRVEEGTLITRYASLVKEALAESHHPTYHILAGDFLMPTLYGTLFGGDPILQIWGALKIRVAVPGNHEFDLPYDTLATAVRRSRFPWVCSNCRDKASGQTYAGMVNQILLEDRGVKVGFVGVISPGLRASFSAGFHPNLEITDPIEAAERAAKALREAGACLVVAVTHQELAEDKILGELVPDIALILGGHTHTVQTSVAGSTYAFRTGHNLQYFGTATVFNDDKPVVRFTTVPVTETVPEDPEMKTLLKEFEGRIEEVLKGEWARIPAMQDLRSSVVRTGGGSFPSAVADIVRETTGADVVFFNSGMFRGDRVFPAGKWPLRFLYEILPFPNRIYVLDVPGKDLKAALEWGLKDYPSPSGAFPVVSGTEIAFDPSRPPLNRIKEVWVTGTPLRENASYEVALTDFLRSGGDGYTMFAGLPLSPSRAQELDLIALLISHAQKGGTIPLRTSRVRLVHFSEPVANGIK
jgi:2',3'-cyclic-nucleotide 2'-phosphodiesterase (5'-nucleotidase family)